MQLWSVDHAVVITIEPEMVQTMLYTYRMDHDPQTTSVRVHRACAIRMHLQRVVHSSFVSNQISLNFKSNLEKQRCDLRVTLLKTTVAINATTLLAPRGSTSCVWPTTTSEASCAYYTAT